jgi:HPt (histidine-containing phosphotransfer) domain-containing protein
MNSKEMDATGPACDSATIAALRDEGDGLLAQLIDIFVMEAPRQMEQLKRALAEEESPAAFRIAHTLKGSAGVFGAFTMESLAALVEQAVRAKSFAAAAAAYPRLSAEIARVIATLARYRA